MTEQEREQLEQAIQAARNAPPVGLDRCWTHNQWYRLDGVCPLCLLDGVCPSCLHEPMA